MNELPQLDPATAAALHHMQCLDDAAAHRTSRLTGPCPDCGPARCADHAADERLVAAYLNRHAVILREFLARADPADVRTVMTGSEETPPTALAFAIAMAARLRELAAEGPVVTTLDGGPVVIELDGGRLLEHPLAPGRPGTATAPRG